MINRASNPPRRPASDELESFRSRVYDCLGRIKSIDNSEFLRLARRAVALATSHPDDREEIAYLVADVWLRCQDRLTPETREIGGVFADLEVEMADESDTWRELALRLQAHRRSD